VRASALRRNLRRVSRELPEGTVVIPMVKADAYGMGMLRAVRALEVEQPPAFGVATVEEGMRLRSAGVEREIIVFSPVPLQAVPDAVQAGLTLSASDVATLEQLAAGGPAARFHVEVDTGMGRSGFDWRAVGEWREAVREAMTHATWCGCFTHFHSADLAGADSISIQWKRFNDALSGLELPKDDFLIHASNSAAALRMPGLAGVGHAVRSGIFLYGGAAGEGLPDPENVASLRARILFVRDAPPGTTLGYGATHRAEGWERWATVGIGYGDGLPRALSNRGRALLKGKEVGIIGRISMDVTVVDITGRQDVSVGDVVTFMGSDGGERISADEIAATAGTIAYEVLTGFTTRVPRIWIDEGG